ncbi:Predicted metalloprotease, contains C-terminal PDZ domain [Hymenobacter gelipurpurascens]|uniref:Predicted metalloprotease, contains C-terminal PDZ domain n=1 Tax=Hymenobacter gelipurpurascens TaxID=89968 RepID=A0A212UGZ6_9BACT|nr:M61 family metallopeptidase [Hymenobacter gelipurpurascens]SNC77517.1 Predicted metalloprotease, contains C-terminal PDZ domain [Hymenobacter gelipurpurascens]
MIHYYVSFENPLTFYLQIQMTYEVAANATQALELQLPAWRPGRYELQNFAQKLQHVVIEDAASGEVLAARKITKDRWQVTDAAGKTVRVRYNFYAHQMDAGGSWLDETQLYLNPVQALFYIEGRQQEACQLALDLPEGWQLACGLPQSGPNTLQAQNFDHLADSPLIASPTLQYRNYEVDGLPFYIWIQGECPVDWPRLVADFRAFSQEQLALFGGFPASDYHFLNQILPYKHYHGVEHLNSTVIVLGPAELLMTEGLYKELLGVSCHELFHAWNIKSIRPIEMQPYDYARENYFRTCFIAEGITTYYGEYLLARAGVRTAAQYFQELNIVLRKHFDDYGRYHLSVADASMDLWLDGYKPGVPDRKVSVYHKGALVALLLDLTLRQLSNHKRSLDDVMRRLWEEFGKTGLGYTEDDYTRIVKEVAGRDMQAYFDKFIYGTAPLEEPLNRVLGFVGCRLHIEQNASASEGIYGFRTVVKNERTEVTDILPDAPAALALTVDDEIVAVNGRRVDMNLHNLLSDGATQHEVTVFRQNRLVTVQLAAEVGHHFWQKITVEKLHTTTPEQQASFQQWLHQEF